MMIEELFEQEVRELVGAYRWQRVVNQKNVYNNTYLHNLITSLNLPSTNNLTT